MKNLHDRVLIDCAPVGLSGRGGHGHNDCLAFEAHLLGNDLIVDRGSYCYTADYRARAEFRGTAAHNTPFIDQTEINTLDPRQLWTLGNQAKPTVRCWNATATFDWFEGSHAGYRRLSSPVRPVRTLVLHHASHTLLGQDAWEGTGTHLISIRFTFSPRLSVKLLEPGHLLLESDGCTFTGRWSNPERWMGQLEPTTVSPSYGVAEESLALCVTCEGTLEPFVWGLGPTGSPFEQNWQAWLERDPRERIWSPRGVQEGTPC